MSTFTALKSLKFNLLLFVLSIFGGSSFAQEFEWVKSTYTGLMNTYAVDVDNDGNIYTTGRFIYSIDFDPGPGEEIRTANPSGGDIFIRKMDTDGNLIWIKTINGSGHDDQAFFIDVSPDGNEIYVGGFFQGSADFDPGIGIHTLTMTGMQNDNYVLKLDGDGNFEWVFNTKKEFLLFENLPVLKRDLEGNIIFAGVFYDECDFDPDLISTHILSADAPFATFVQKLTADGELIWAHKIPRVGTKNITIDSENNILLIGEHMEEVDFDWGPSEFTLDPDGVVSAYVLRITPDGAFDWVKQIKGSGEVKGIGITEDNEGNIIYAGIFEDTADLNPGIDTLEFISNGNFDHFFMKLDNDGNLLWVNVLGNSYVNWARREIIVNSSNEIFISGGFRIDSLDIDPGISEQMIQNFGLNDFYILKLTEDGELIWFKQSNGNDHENITCMAIDPIDQLYVVGQFANTVDFDFCPLSVNNLTSPPMQTSEYILKLNSCEFYGDTINAEGCKVYVSPSGEVYSESGTYYETFTSYCDCDSIVTLNITVWELNTAISQDGALFTAVEDEIGTTYQWLDCDDDYAIIPGATDQFYYATEPGNYCVALTLGSCTDTTACYTFSQLGETSDIIELNAKIYPNPNNGNFKVDLGQSYQTVFITITDVAGKIVLNSSYQTIQSFVIEMEKAPGLYFLEIRTTSGQELISKLIIE